MLDSYKCSNCGGYTAFDATLGKLYCLGCRREEIAENYEPQYASYFCQDDVNQYQDNDARQYICRQCHSTIITDNHSAISTCPFCGGQTSLGERLTGESAPTHVIPFQVSKQQATRAFRKWCRKLPFSPQDFPKKHPVKQVTGIYIPCMCYDIRVQGETIVNALRREKSSSPEEEREEISFYNLYRKNDLLFHYLPVSNSKNIDDKLLEQLCPFNFRQMERFSPRHLEAHFAEKYALASDKVFLSAKKKAEKYAEEYILHTVRDYEEPEIAEKDYHIGKNSSKYVLLPVWLVMYDYGNKEYIFAMNGQTGKIACEPPKSWVKIGTGAGLIALAIFMALRIITLLLGGPLL